MTQSTHLALPYIDAAQAQKHVTHNEALQLLDALVHLSVSARNEAAPPPAPTEGQRVLVGASATGAFAGKDFQIATFLAGAWVFLAPQAGWRVFVEAETLLLVYDGAAWKDAGLSLRALQNLTLLGVGAAADANNPLLAKLNAALFTAKTVAEGGTGDLRYVLNKESAAKTVSQLYQTNFSGRAEIGLTGDDNLHVKVSPDGAALKEAIVVKSATGFVGIGDTAALDRLTVSNNVTPLPAGTAGTVIHCAQADGVVHRALYDSFGAAVAFGLRRANGTAAAPTALVTNNQVGSFGMLGFGATGYSSGTRALVTFNAAENWTDAAQGTYITFNTTNNGAGFAIEKMRIDDAGNVQINGVNTVIDQNRHFFPRSYTIGTLPVPSTLAANALAYGSDLGGGRGLLSSDGMAWRRTGRGQQTVASNADFTLTVLINAEEQRHTGTLTANRTITLSTTNAYAGARFRVTRTGAGVFNLSLGGLKNLVMDSWAEAVYDGAAWYLAAQGLL